MHARSHAHTHTQTKTQTNKKNFLKIQQQISIGTATLNTNIPISSLTKAMLLFFKVLTISGLTKSEFFSRKS